jgi:hypothetical protein
MTAPGADLTDRTSSNLWRDRFDDDAKATAKEMRRWSWIRRAWHYIVDCSLV